MKPKDEFSQSQLRRLADMVARGQRIDSTKGVITCIAHSGAPQDELKCRGPCGKYKHISEFSKNMRKSSGGRRVRYLTDYLSPSQVRPIFLANRDAVVYQVHRVVRGNWQRSRSAAGLEQSPNPGRTLPCKGKRSISRARRGRGQSRRSYASGRFKRGRGQQLCQGKRICNSF